MNMNGHYVVVSDVHLHKWSAFSETNSDGINSRLQILLDGLKQAAAHAARLEMKRMYITGDLFHVRGSIAPSVMNPAIDTFKEIMAMGIEVRMIPGNHDLESKDSKALTNANQALEGIGCVVCNELTYFEDDKVVMVPWYDRHADLTHVIEDWRVDYMSEGDNETPDSATYMIHAPMNGVIRGIPDHGINPEDIGFWGHRVFCGHYHNHREFRDEVFSVGALTHQTWGDVDTKAGYLLVTPEMVEHHEVDAPKFMDFNESWTEEECLEFCSGNYVRVKLEDVTEAEIKEIRAGIIDDYKALGVIVNAVPKSKVVERSGASVAAGESMEVSISSWIKTAALGVDEDKLQRVASEILSECEEI